MSNTQEVSDCHQEEILHEYDELICSSCDRVCKPFIHREKEITNCKECGHENPKKFMGKEYISHAPGCSQEVADSTDSFEERLIQKVREIRALVYIEDAQNLFFKILSSEREKVRQEERERIEFAIANLSAYGTILYPLEWAYLRKDVEAIFNNKQQ